VPPGPPPVERLDDRGIVRQRSRDDCGVAVVAMLVRAAGRDVDLEDLWRSARVPPGGLSLREMAALSERLGMRTTPFAMAAKDPRTPATPWVAHLSWNHYVLVESADDTRVVVADPRGRRDAYSLQAFTRAWSGYGLAITE
jgi:ATP-binding cassette subfamily B protein RaxB